MSSTKLQPTGRKRFLDVFILKLGIFSCSELFAQQLACKSPQRRHAGFPSPLPQPDYDVGIDRNFVVPVPELAHDSYSTKGIGVVHRIVGLPELRGLVVAGK